MKPKTHQQQMIDEINLLLDSYQFDTKEKTLIYQRGLLTGWLAKIASTDFIVRQELEARLEQRGAGTENRTRK
jgi:hypothetical protein